LAFPREAQAKAFALRAKNAWSDLDELYLRGMDASQIFYDVGADVGLLLEEATPSDVDDNAFESIGEDELYTFLEMGVQVDPVGFAAAAFPLPPSALSPLPPTYAIYSIVE
jgi:hypothetical protein